MESSSKQLFLADYLTVINDAFNKGKTIRISVIGCSMLPTLSSDDSVILDKPENIKKGDIILYNTTGTTYSMHRVKKLGEPMLVVGDNNIQIEKVKSESVVAKVTSIVKKDKTINSNSFTFRYYAYLASVRRFFKRVINWVKK